MKLTLGVRRAGIYTQVFHEDAGTPPPGRGELCKMVLAGEIAAAMQTTSGLLPSDAIEIRVEIDTDDREKESEDNPARP